MNRRIAIFVGVLALIAAAVVALEFSGNLGLPSLTGAATGGAGPFGAVLVFPVEVPPEIGDPVELPRPPGDPISGQPGSRWLQGRYIVRVSAAANDGAEVLEQRLVTGLDDLDTTWDDLAAAEMRPVFDAGERMKPSGFDLGLDRVYSFRSDEEPESVLAALEELSDVDWIEPVTVLPLAVVADDPHSVYQWHFHMLDMMTAWEISDGTGVTVAVVDTGVSEGEDGFHELLAGVDLLANDDDPSDEDGHGTHVAGTIAQKTGNGLGVAGMAPGASILPIRACGLWGCPSDRIAEGIQFAVDSGAQVINLSLGGDGESLVLKEAMEYAEQSGVLVVAASGNDGNSSGVSHPANIETVVAVGAVTINHEITGYSNQGDEIAVVAPGGNIHQDANGDGVEDGVMQETNYGGGWSYRPLNGTSMASPHVAGLAALLIANGTTDVEDLRKALTETADDLGDEGWDSTYGHGLINPVAALWYPEEPPSEETETQGGTWGGGDEATDYMGGNEEAGGCSIAPRHRD